MYREQHTAHMFICKHDLDLLWAEYPLRNIFPKFTPDEIEATRDNYIRVLSILIYVGWADLRSRFRPVFLREKGRDDTHLPFSDVTFLGTSGQVFSSHQYAFTPTIIEEHNEKHIQEISIEYRLPFIGEPKNMRVGGYGSVTEREIAPRCLWNKEENKDNPEVGDHVLLPYGIQAHCRDLASQRLSPANTTRMKNRYRTSNRKSATSISSKKASQTRNG